MGEIPQEKKEVEARSIYTRVSGPRRRTPWRRHPGVLTAPPRPLRPPPRTFGHSLYLDRF